MAASKSRTFAIVSAVTEDTIHLTFATRLTEGMSKRMEIRRSSFPKEDLDTVNQIIDLLTQAGLTVRYYSQDEKQWMDNSLAHGLMKAPGQRDGQWTEPDLEEFEAHYLTTK